jgi:hypothetical protein
VWDPTTFTKNRDRLQNGALVGNAALPPRGAGEHEMICAENDF